MNSEHFHEWIKEVVIALPNGAVLVLDQASYHRTVTDETRNPTTTYRKYEIIAWVEDHNVPIPLDEESFSEMTRVKLLQLSKKHQIRNELKVGKNNC